MNGSLSGAEGPHWIEPIVEDEYESQVMESDQIEDL